MKQFSDVGAFEISSHYEGIRAGVEVIFLILLFLFHFSVRQIQAVNVLRLRAEMSVRLLMTMLLR